MRRTGDEPLFNSLIEHHHYLGYEQPVGEHLKYLVWAQGRPIACMAWSSAPRHLGSRDRFIGWSGEARRRNIRYLAYNTRFLILPWVEVPHLASHILGRMARQISQDWERIYGHPIFLLETFIDPERFRGTCYRAANWILLGRTTGRGKDDQTHRPNRSIKEVFGTSPSPAISRVTSEHIGIMKPERLDVTSEELEALLEGVRAPLGEASYQKLQAAIRTLSYVTELLESREATLDKLRRLLCHSSTEKTGKVLKQAGIETDGKKHTPPVEHTPKRKAPGHGRNSAAAYRGARKVEVPHGSLKSGDPCPDGNAAARFICNATLVCWCGLKGKRLSPRRCTSWRSCGATSAGMCLRLTAPEGAGEEKYDETAASMIAMLRYGSGFPWNRLEGLQENMGIPLPAATQCEIVKETAAQIQPAGDELIRQAAQGDVVHNDDTSMRVLSLDRDAASDADIAAERTGVFTSGIVSIGEGHRIGLYFTGRKHAGENLADVLKQRAAGLGRADPDVRRAVAQSAQVTRETGNHRRALPRPCSAPLCRGHAELPAGVPVCIGESG